MQSMEMHDPITASDENLSGLRSFLDDWNSGNGPDRERDEKTMQARQDSTRAHIYSSYIKQAEQEDKVLVERWTETSNILLVFSGLQSAIVVAFIIFAETSTNDLIQTNALLQSILYNLDNSTTLPSENRPGQGGLSIDVRISACWYTSLACSLLSAFGGLLSKQWVIHYASRPLWANTTALHCRLRELRHDGLGRWKVGWFMDSLVILLQLSVLAFAIGLISHLSNTSRAHFTIILSFTSFGGATFVVTLIAGTLLPGCPFKSSITGYLYKVIMTVTFSLLHAPVWVLARLAELLIRVYPSDGLSLWIRRTRLWLQAMATRIEVVVEAGDIESEALQHRGAGAAGILCWWVVQEDSEYAEDRVSSKMVVEEVLSFPRRVVTSLLVQTWPFTSWSSKVVNNLRALSLSSSSSRNFHLQMGELLCDVMDRNWVARLIALRAVKSNLLNHPGEFCSILREAWCTGQRSNVLPIALMRWPTISLYLQLQYRSWASMPYHGEPLDHIGLTQDLSVILLDSRLEETKDISNAVALAALTVSNSDVPEANQLRVRYFSERLLKSLHLLSIYPVDNHPSELLLSAVYASAIGISNYLDGNYYRYLIRSRSWRNGDTARSLLRLLRLGSSWCSHDELRQNELGAKLVNEVWWILCKVVAHLVTRRITPGWFVLSSDEGLTTVLQSYGHTPANSPPNLDALRVIDFVLGLRCYRPQRGVTRYLSWTNWNTTSTLPDSDLAGVLTDYPHTISRMIHDIENSELLSEERRIVLSMLIRGRRTFFSPSIICANESLQQILDLAGTQSGGSLMPLEETAFHEFHQWGEVVAALRQLERGSQEKESGVVTDHGSSGI